MMEAKAKKDLTWVHFVIILLLMFGVQYIPPVEPTTAYGMKILGVFAGLLWGWSFCGMLWPSIMGIVALAVTGCYDTGDTAIVAAFGNYMVLNCLFLFVLVELLSDCGLVDYICRRLMAMEAIKGRPWLLFSVVLFIPFLLSAVGQVFSAVYLGWKIAYSVLDIAGYERDSRTGRITIISSMLAIAAGSQVLPFLSSALMICGAFSQMVGEAFNYGKYMIFSVPFALLNLVELVLVVRFFFKMDVEKFAHVDLAKLDVGSEASKMTLRQKVSGIAFLIALAMLLLPNFLPEGNIISNFLTSLGMTGTCMLIVVILVLLKIDGKPVLDYNGVAKKAIYWDMIIFLAVVLCVSTLLTAEETGITAFLNGVMQPLLGLKSGYLFVVLFLAVASILTQFMNNTVVAIMFLPIVLVASSSYGLNSWALVTVLIGAAQFIAYATPAACPNAGMMYSCEYTPYKKSVKFVVPVLLVWFVSLITLGYGLACVAFI